MSYRNHTIKTFYFLLVIGLALNMPFCWAGGGGELLLFPQAGLDYRPGLNDISVQDKDDHEVGVDLFFTYESNNFRLLGEFLLTNKEHDFERLQIGWLHNNNVYWLGRFHNPVGYWNTQHHHGAYFQTSISRPAIVEFEENGGILTMHQTGLLIEGRFDYGENDLGYALSLAMGPEYTHELEPVDLLNPGSGENDTSVSLNLHHDFGTSKPVTLGLFGNFTIIPSSVVDVVEIEQTNAGIYAMGDVLSWRWHGAAHYVHNQLQRVIGSESGAFINVYLQVEYMLDERWKFFGRVENTVGNHDDAYLELFPKFVENMVMGGVRYDFARQNALKLEISANQTQSEDFKQIMLQWSAQF